MTTHVIKDANEEAEIKELEAKMDGLLGEIDTNLSNIKHTAKDLDGLDSDLSKADEILDELQDEVTEFEESKGDEIDSLILQSLDEGSGESEQ